MSAMHGYGQSLRWRRLRPGLYSALWEPHHFVIQVEYIPETDYGDGGWIGYIDSEQVLEVPRRTRRDATEVLLRVVHHRTTGSRAGGAQETSEGVPVLNPQP